MTLIGELAKMVPVSKMRIASINAPTGSKTIELSLIGAPGEVVSMSYIVKDCMDITSASATIGADGTAALSLA